MGEEGRFESDVALAKRDQTWGRRFERVRYAFHVQLRLFIAGAVRSVTGETRTRRRLHCVG